MEFENFKVTKRETLVAIAITLALIGLGIIISEAIKRINSDRPISTMILE